MVRMWVSLKKTVDGATWYSLDDQARENLWCHDWSDVRGRPLCWRQARMPPKWTIPAHRTCWHKNVKSQEYHSKFNEGKHLLWKFRVSRCTINWLSQADFQTHIVTFLSKSCSKLNELVHFLVYSHPKNTEMCSATVISGKNTPTMQLQVLKSPVWRHGLSPTAHLLILLSKVKSGHL